MTVSPGRFITLEGGEGAGKSTQIKFLAEFLAGKGVKVVMTREPGGSPGAEAIREILLKGTDGGWEARTEALLHYAARQEHLCKTVIPALERGDWVLCDRFADSTMAYQGYGHGLEREFIRRLHRLTLGEIRPDLTVILDIDPEKGFERVGKRGETADYYESMERDFHKRLRQGFLEIAKAEPKRCVVLDASKDADVISSEISAVATERFGLQGE